MNSNENSVRQYAEYERLVDEIDQALRDDGWLGHDTEITDWHINVMANAIAKRLQHIDGTETETQ